MLHHIRLNAIPAGCRLQCILGLLAVLWHQDRKCFSPTGEGQQQPGCQGVGDMLSHMLALLLDASIGTSVFHCLPPHVLLQCLHTMATQVVPYCLCLTLAISVVYNLPWVFFHFYGTDFYLGFFFFFWGGALVASGPLAPLDV